MRIHRRIATRLSAVIVVIVTASAILMGLSITRSGTDLLVNAATERLKQENRLVSVRLQDILDTAQRDVEFIANSPAVIDLASTMDASGKKPAQIERGTLTRSHLQDMFVALLNKHPWYGQIRLIGVADGGREVVGVDLATGGIQRVRESGLQQRGDLIYYQNALDEPPGKVYWSSIELNREHGKIVEPAQPVLRAAMPVAGRYGSPIGVVVITLDIRRVFDAASAVLAPDIRLYIANKAGDYLYHPDPSRTFGFEHGQSYLIQDDFTDSAQKLYGKSSLILENALPAGATEPVIAHISRLPLKATGGDSILVGLTRPRAQILAEVGQSSQQSTWLIAPFILVALVVVIWMIELFIGPLERITREVSRYTPGRGLHLPELGRKDEVGQLSQAFARLVERIDLQVMLLEEQGQRFKSLFEAVPDAVVIIDEDGSMEYTNPATQELFGYTPDELHGKNIRILMPEPYRSHHDQYMNRYLEGGEPHIIGIGRKVVGLHKNGGTMALYLSIGEFTLRGRRKFTGILHGISILSDDRQPA
jgi:PAS domain S-box-containing protein